jgi:hypothetical protein
MWTVLFYLAVCFAPAAAFYCFAALVEGRFTDLNWRRRRAEPATLRGIEQLVADLRRLELQIERVERSNLPAKAKRLRALTMAYDDTLAACCAALGLPRPGESPLSSLQRLETEADLVQRGLTW